MNSEKNNYFTEAPSRGIQNGSSMKKQAFVALLLVLLCSGCVEISSIFGNSIQGVNVNEKTQTERSDILLIQGVDTLPRSPLFAGQTFTLYFRIVNVDSVRTAKNVRVELIDSSIFVPVAGFSDCVLGCEIPPMGEKQISADFTAPESDQIAFTTTSKRISFRVLYDTDSTTLYDVIVLDKNEVLRQQQAGKTLTINSNRIVGSGPVKVYPSLSGDNFIMEGTSRSIMFTIRNEGSGMLEDNVIRKNRMSITFPSNFSATGSFLQKSAFDQAVTGNAIATGMATGCSEFCGIEASVPIVSGTCPDGCPCYFNQECVSGYCMLYAGGESGGQCAQPGSSVITTTTVRRCSTCSVYNDPESGACTNAHDCDIGCSCNCHSDCISGFCSMSEFGGMCAYPATTTTIYGCPAECTNPSSYTNYQKSVCSLGCHCLFSDQCKSGSCDYGGDPMMPYGTCVTTPSTVMAQCPDQCAGSSCDFNRPCGLGCACTCDYECSSGTFCRNGICSSSSTTTTTSYSGSSSRTTVRTTTTLHPASEKMFSCAGGVCHNVDEIDLFGKESSPLMFRIDGPRDIMEQIYRIYTVTASIEYTYELRDQKDITIMPVENVPGGEW